MPFLSRQASTATRINSPSALIRRRIIIGTRKSLCLQRAQPIKAAECKAQIKDIFAEKAVIKDRKFRRSLAICVDVALPVVSAQTTQQRHRARTKNTNQTALEPHRKAFGAQFNSFNTRIEFGNRWLHEHTHERIYSAHVRSFSSLFLVSSNRLTHAAARIRIRRCERRRSVSPLCGGVVSARLCVCERAIWRTKSGTHRAAAIAMIIL